MVDEHKHSPARMRDSNIFCTLRRELQTDAAPVFHLNASKPSEQSTLLWFADCQNSTTFNLAPPGTRGSLGLECVEGLTYQIPSTFSRQTLLEALIVTGASAFCFGEQYRDLPLLYLHQKLDENNINEQEVQTAVQQYKQYTMVCSLSHQTLYFLLMVISLQNSAVSPTRRGVPPRDVWNAESPTKRLFLP